MSDGHFPLPFGQASRFRVVRDDEPTPERVWCGECGYSMDGLDPDAGCPECGASPTFLVTDKPGLELLGSSAAPAEPTEGALTHAAGHRRRVLTTLAVGTGAVATHVAGVLLLGWHPGQTALAVLSAAVFLGGAVLWAFAVPIVRVGHTWRRAVAILAVVLMIAAWLALAGSVCAVPTLV